MRKEFKLLSAAIGVMALTGCVNDDIPGLSSGPKVDLSGKTVLSVHMEDASTRASQSEAGGFWWNEGDELRVYDSKLQKYDKFKFATDDEKAGVSYFALEGETSDVDEIADGKGKRDYAFALFSGGGAISYAGWKKGSDNNVALLKIEDEIEYNVDQTIKDENGDTVVYYKSVVPMWGAVEPIGADSEEDTKSAFKTVGGTTIKYLAGQLNVIFKNNSAANVTSVRATAYNWKEDGKPTEEELATLKEAIKSAKGQTTSNLDLTDYVDLAQEVNEGNQMAGWLEAVLNEDGVIRPTDEASVSNEGSSNSITVNLADKKAGGYTTNMVIIPLVPRTYDVLLIEYCVDSEWVLVNCATNLTVSRKNIVKTTVDLPLTSEAENLTQINEFLAALKAPTSDVTITFTKKVASFVVGKANNVLGQFADNTLIIPNTWDKDCKVTLNFEGGNETENGLITSGSDKLEWTVKKGNTVYTEQPIEPATMRIENKGCVNVEINVKNESERYSRPVTVNVAEAGGGVTLGKNIRVITAEATTGTIVVDASETKTDRTTEKNAAANPAKNVTVEVAENGSADVKVVGVGGMVASLINNGNGHVEVLGATVEKLVNNGTGTVTVDKGNFYTLENNGGAVKVTDKTGFNSKSLKHNSTANLTIGNSEGNTTEANINEIVTNATTTVIENVNSWDGLTIAGDGKKTVKVDNYITKVLTHTGHGMVTYHSTGASAVIKNSATLYDAKTGSGVKFESVWDGEPVRQLTGDHMTKDMTTEDNVNTFDVYTAAELAMLLNSSALSTTTLNNLTVNLYADIDLAKGTWSGIYLDKNCNITLMGNNKTIKNVNISGTYKSQAEGRSQSQYGFGFINEVKNIRVEDLTLSEVNTKELKLGEKNNAQISGIGGLVGRVNGIGSLKNVTVEGTILGLSLASDDDWRKFDGNNTESCKIGGLVGMFMTGNSSSEDKFTVEDCTVDVQTITGQWALGGLIGDGRMQNGTFELKNNTVKVGQFVPTLHILVPDDKKQEDEVSNFYGRIGMLMGCIADYDFTAENAGLSIEDKTGKITDVIVGQQKALGFSKNVRTTTTNTIESFKGFTHSGILYVGYSGGDEYVSKGKFSLKFNDTEVTDDDVPTTVEGLNIFHSYSDGQKPNFAKKKR